jgi:hypothetical protein
MVVSASVSQLVVIFTCKLLVALALVQISVAVLLINLSVRVENKNALTLLPVATAIVSALLGLLLPVQQALLVRMAPVSFLVKVVVILARLVLL